MDDWLGTFLVAAAFILPVRPAGGANKACVQPIDSQSSALLECPGLLERGTRTGHDLERGALTSVG